MNRDFQLQILRACQQYYPDPLNWKEVVRIFITHHPEEDLPHSDEDLENTFMITPVVFISDDPSNNSDLNESLRLDPPNKLLAPLSYLEEHGLLKKEFTYSGQVLPDALITAKGIDFLEDDGGLSAILNTVTVKFDMDNVREIVEAGILKMDVPEEKQSALKEAIRQAPGSMLQTAVSTMVEKGMSDPIGTAKTVAGLFGVSF